MLERLFHLREKRTTTRTELLAGVTTFLTMSYIIFVQPAVLSGTMFGSPTGMDFGAVTTATCLPAALASAIMGLYAKYPIAQAPAAELESNDKSEAQHLRSITWAQRLKPCTAPSAADLISASITPQAPADRRVRPTSAAANSPGCVSARQAEIQGRQRTRTRGAADHSFVN